MSKRQAIGVVLDAGIKVGVGIYLFLEGCTLLLAYGGIVYLAFGLDRLVPYEATAMTVGGLYLLVESMRKIWRTIRQGG